MMTKKLLKQMVEVSYNGQDLDVKKVEAIASRLSRKELREYIRALKIAERKICVLVDVPTENGEKYLKDFQSLFPNKKLVFRKDASLVFGTRVTDNDIVYAMNLRDSLQGMLRYVEETL